MNVVHNCNLAPYNAYRIAARCNEAYFPETPAQVHSLMEGPLRHRNYILLGSGHNVILARNHYETPFVIFHGNMNRVQHQGTMLQAGAGAFTQEVCEYACMHALSGFEMFYDIPSSIGGAVFMNAEAYQEDIAGILHEATFWNPGTHRVETRPRDQLAFSYRQSLFQENTAWLILEAAFDLQAAPRHRIREKMESIKAKRWASQPREYPNAGSVFKRPQGRYVGPMLDALNLKGYQLGGFRVSPKHSGFIEKTGPGTGAELLALITDIRQKVQAAFQVDLALEQRVINAP